MRKGKKEEEIIQEIKGKCFPKGNKYSGLKTKNPHTNRENMQKQTNKIHKYMLKKCQR